MTLKGKLNVVKDKSYKTIFCYTYVVGDCIIITIIILLSCLFPKWVCSNRRPPPATIPTIVSIHNSDNLIKS